LDDFAHIKRCIDLTAADVGLAVESRDATLALLAHLARVAAPGTGVAKSLLVFARMATTACEWLDGDLRIEIVGDAEVSAVEVLEELGMGMRERVFPPFAFVAPLEEFSRAVERVPHMIEPLVVHAKTARRMVLGATAELRRSSLPPKPVTIAEESFFVPRAPPALKEAVPEEPTSAALPLVGALAERPRKRSSRPPSRRNDPSSARIAVAGKKITVTREAPPPELPLVTAAKAAPPRPPPAPKKAAPPAAPMPAAPPPSAEEKKDEGEEIDAGWDET
jgi:hypothetical protein